MNPPLDIMETLGLRDPVHVVTTKIADIWQVTDTSGQHKALKIYKGRDPQDEGPGFHLIQAAHGAGCVQVDHFASGVALMEWLDGPTAGDLTRGGNDTAGLNAMIVAVKDLHTALPAPQTGLRPVHDDIDILQSVTYATQCPPHIRAMFDRCKRLGADMLQTQGPPRPLHGDVHHDNVIITPRGPLLLDAKGQLGEAPYETANMFRNPVGADTLLRDPARTRWMADTLGAAFDCPPQRLLQMAAVRSALSTIWQYGTTIPAAPEGIDILAMQLTLVPDT